MSLRSAPAVQVFCTGGRIWRAVWVLLPTLACGVLVAWALLQLGLAPLLSWAAAAAAGLLAMGLLHKQHPPEARLCWDGAQWLCDDRPVSPEVMLDLDGWLLLRLTWTDLAPGQRQGRRWLAVDGRDAGPHLHALRLALFARQPHGDASAGLMPGP